jgi:uncharacterized protein YndB with AHSA1/START domain
MARRPGRWKVTLIVGAARLSQLVVRDKTWPAVMDKRVFKIQYGAWTTDIPEEEEEAAMSDIQVAVSSVIDAPPARVYAVLADYRNHHPQILPKAYFVKVDVTKGGQGAGTEFVADMSIYGSKRTLRMTVSEPEPGRVIAETDAKLGTHTTFTVDPLDDGAKSSVTIATTSRTSAGLGSWLEKLTTPMIMRKIYQEELQQLNAYMKHLPAER